MSNLDAFRAALGTPQTEKETENSGALAAYRAALSGTKEQTPATASASDYEKLLLPKPSYTPLTERIAQTAQSSNPLALPTPEEWANRAQSELAGALRTVPGGSVTVQPAQRTTTTRPDNTALVEKLRAAAPKSEAAEGVSHKSGKFDEGSLPERQDELRDKIREDRRIERAFTPLESGMYLTPESARIAGEQERTAKGAASEAREAEEKLRAIGGRFGAKDTAQTLVQNLVAGEERGVKGLLNAGGYAGQEITKGQLAEQISTLYGLGQIEEARQLEKVQAELNEAGLQTYSHYGDEDAQRAAEMNAASGKGVRLAGNVAQGLGGMLTSIAANLAAPGTGLWVMMTQAAGNATEEAKAAGTSDEKALLYGTAVGAVEALTEKITGGIPGLGVGALDDVAEGLVKRALKSEAAQKAAMLLVKALGEGVEEFTSEFADYGLNRWLVKNDERSLGEVHKDAWYSALIGALTSFVMSTPGEVLERMSPKEMARTVADETVERAEVNQRAEDLKLPTAENEKTAPEGTAGKALPNIEDVLGKAESEIVSVTRKLAESIPVIADMYPVANVTGNEVPKRGRPTERALEFLKTIGNKVHRDGFGDVLFSKNNLKGGLIGHGISDAKMDMVAAVPAVIEQGKQIDYQKNWKGRQWDAYVFAAPVTYKNKPTYLAAVVAKDNTSNRYYLHQVVDENGNVLFEREEAPDTAVDGTSALSGDHDTVNRSGASVDSVAQPGEEVKTGLELPAVPVEEQAESRPLPAPEGFSYSEWENGTQAAEMPAEAPAAPAAAEEAPAGDGMSDGGYSQTGYAASPGLRKLGVKIAEPITSTIGGDVLLAQAKKAQAAERNLNKAIRKLKPTIAEKALAKGLADGTYTEGGGVYYGPDGAALKNVNMGKVRELAEYYRQKAQYKADRIANQRRNIRMNETEKADELLRNADAFKQMGALRLNLNTPKRNMLAWAGQTLGEKINRHLFDPVERNSAERIRFAERMRDRVRDFHLTKAESEMVQRVIEGTAVQDQVSKLTEDSRRRVNAAAESKDFDLTAAEYNLNAEEKALARRYHEWLQTKVDLETMDAEKINAAAKAYTDAYSDFYTAINEFLVMHGYEPIGFIEGYAPHLQSDQVQTTLGKLLQAFGMDAEVSALPTEIAGRTENFKPGHQWNPYFQHRAGADSLIDAVAGYDSYVEYMSNVLYHTDDIQKLRIFANELRAMYASKEVREKIDQAKWLLGQSAQDKLDFLRINGMIGEGTQLTPEDATQRVEEYIDELFKKIEDKTIHGNVVSWLDDYTNKLAGKQTKLDRAVESFFGRRAINAGNALSRTFGESAVVGNLSSALNQLAQLPAVQSEVGNKYVLQAIYDILRGNTGDMDTESDFLTGKRGTESLLNERKWSELDARQKHDRVTEKMSIPFETVDMLVSRLYVRAKYLQELANGKSHQEAMRSADDFVERVVGNRIQGSRPMAFESKNAAAKLLTTFQLEVANAWAHISQDLPTEIKEIAQTQGKPAAVKRTAEIILRYSVSAFLLNRLAETVYGGTPAPFDILGYVLGGLAAGNGETVNQYLVELVGNLLGFGGDDDEEEKDFDTGAALKEAGNLVVGDLPYVRNAASLLGYGDTTLPLPQVGNTVKAAGKLVSGKGSAGDLGKAALKDAATWLPGGNQLKKTAQGIETVARGGRYDSQGNLMYPVDFSGAEGAAKAAKAIAFGRSSLGATDAYFASGDRALSKAQTEAYEYLVGIGENPHTVYDTMQAVRGVKNVTGTDEDGKEKRDILRRADLDDYSKAQLYSVLLSSGEDAQQKTYEKLAGMMDLGLDFDDCMDVVDKYKEVDAADEKAGMKASRFAQWADENFDEDQAAKIKDAYKYWQNIPAEASGYDLAVKAGTDLETAEAAREIKSSAEGEKDADGELIDGSKKVEVIRGVDSLDISNEEKIALLGSMGYASSMEDYNALSGWLNLGDYADIQEVKNNAKGKQVGGKTVSGSVEYEVMEAINALDASAAHKSQLLEAMGYKADETPWSTSYRGDDYEAYYYMTPSERESYLTYCDWMDAGDYAKYAASIGDFHNINNAEGKTLVSRKEQVIEYINALPLLEDQKTALYVASGYNPNMTDKGFADCPWWNSLQLRTQYYPK